MLNLVDLREEIDTLDSQLIAVLGRRLEVCRRIAHLKKEQNIAMMQPGRVAEIKRRCSELAMLYGVDPAFMVNLYTLIISETCRLEDEIIGTALSAS